MMFNLHLKTRNSRKQKKKVMYWRRRSERNALACIKNEKLWKEIEVLPQKEYHDWKENIETKIYVYQII